MARKRDKRLLRTVAYVFSGLVVLSMVLSLLGPVLFRESATPTPTWPPTWTATSVAPTLTPTGTPPSATPSPTYTGTPTATLTPAS
jgi:hypothetical protein